MTSRDLKQTKKSQPLEKIAGALHFRTPPPFVIDSYHKETLLNANRSPNPNPKGGTKVQ